MTGDLLIMGCAACLWDDLARYDHIHGDNDRMAVNEAIMHYAGRLQHGAGLHEDSMFWFAGFRAKCFRPGEGMVAHLWQRGTQVMEDIPGVPTRVWDLQPQIGSSGLFAVQVAMELGYGRIVLAGMPIDNSPHFFRPEPYDFVPEYWQGWREAHPRLLGRVTSLSGNTMRLLGSPL